MTMTSSVHPNEEEKSSEKNQIHTRFVKKSLGFVDIDFKIRKLVINIIRPGSCFNSFILVNILLNSLAMALLDYRFIDENYNPRTDLSTINYVINKSEYIFFCIFFLEFFMKIIAHGFFFGKNTYLRDHWNQLDFIVLVMSAIGMTPLLSNMSFIRTVRVLRPLRSISRLPGLRKIIGALIDSIGDLWNVMCLLTFLLFCFSTAGILFWSGKFHARCRLTPYPIIMPKACRSIFEPCWQDHINSAIISPDQYRCLPDNNDSAQWTQSTSPWFVKGSQDCVWPIDLEDERICSITNTGIHKCVDKRLENGKILHRVCGSNYDNFGNPRFWNTNEPYGIPRMQSGTFISSLNWGYTNFDNFFSAFVTSFQIISLEGWTDIMYQAIDIWYVAPTIAFFLLFNLIGGHIVLNLVLAVITGSLDNLEKTNSGTRAKIERKPFEKKECKKYIVESQFFGNFIMICIVANTIILGMDRYNIPKETETVLETFNLVLNIIFFAEMCLLISAFGFKKYFQNPLFIFDGFIVILSIIEMIISTMQQNSGSGQSVFSVFRALRIFRIFKLAKRWKSLNNLLRTMYSTVLEIGNFAILLFIFIFIYALIGMQLFANRMHFDPVTGYVIAYNENGYDTAYIPRSNFDTFGWAMTTVFQILSGENWNSIMYDGRRATSSIAVIYFISLVVVGVFIVMSLFLAILIKNFEDEDDNSDNNNSNTIEKESTHNIGQFFSEFIKKVKEKYKQEMNKKGSTRLQQKLKRILDYFRDGGVIQSQLYRVVEHSKFDNVITAIIILSSICLALDNPLLDPETWRVKVLFNINIVFTIIFTLEMIAKILAYGFILSSNAYLKNAWNLLDFIVVMISILDLVNLGPGQVLRAVRTLRILRPLRMISRFPELKIVVDALISSLPAVFNVAICCTLFFFIFAIFGVNFLKGTFYHCDGVNFQLLPISTQNQIINPTEWIQISELDKSLFHLENSECNTDQWDDQYIPTSKEMCQCLCPGEWVKVIPQTFDDVFSAMSLLFEISTTEGWVDVMFAAIDQRGMDSQPIRNSNPVWVLFFIFFLLVGAFFVLELFVGVIIENFNKIRDKTGRMLMTEAQKEWASTQKFIMKIKPEKRLLRPEGIFRSKCYDFVMPGTNPSFEKAIMLLIVIGSICTAMTGFGDSDRKTTILEIISIGLTLIFFAETTIKLTAHQKKYFQDGWNIFDFIVVCSTVVGLILTIIFPNLSSITSIIRLCRVGRLFRLIKSVKSLRILFNTLLTSIPSIANIGSLLLLLFFIFSVCGVQLFSMTKSNDNLNDQANFRSFGNAMLLLVRFSTGENWNGFMRSMLENEKTCNTELVFNPDSPWCLDESKYEDCTNLNACCGEMSIYLYFYSFTLIVSFVIFNLFVGVVLEAFENSEEGEILNPEDLEHFTNIWADFDPDATWYISINDLQKFVLSLEPPLGFRGLVEEENGVDNEEINRNLQDIPVNDEGLVNIVQVANHLAKRLAREKLGDAFSELPADDLIGSLKNRVVHRTLRDIMKSSKGDVKEGKIERFKTAASLLGKRAVKEKDNLMKLEMSQNKILPIVDDEVVDSIENP